MKEKILFIGGCILRPIIFRLESCKEFTDKYEIVDVNKFNLPVALGEMVINLQKRVISNNKVFCPWYKNASESEINQVKKLTNSVDYIVFQPGIHDQRDRQIIDEYTFAVPDLLIDKWNISDIIKNTSTPVISISQITYPGYMYHSYILFQSLYTYGGTRQPIVRGDPVFLELFSWFFKTGMSNKQIEHWLLNESTDQLITLLDMYHTEFITTYTNLYINQKSNFFDSIDLAGCFKNNYDNVLLMLDRDHPTPTLYDIITTDFLRKIGIDFAGCLPRSFIKPFETAPSPWEIKFIRELYPHELEKCQQTKWCYKSMIDHEFIKHNIQIASRLSQDSIQISQKQKIRHDQAVLHLCG